MEKYNPTTALESKTILPKTYLDSLTKSNQLIALLLSRPTNFLVKRSLTTNHISNNLDTSTSLYPFLSSLQILPLSVRMNSWPTTRKFFRVSGKGDLNCSLNSVPLSVLSPFIPLIMIPQLVPKISSVHSPTSQKTRYLNSIVHKKT
jgi:hypothetical protein